MPYAECFILLCYDFEEEKALHRVTKTKRWLNISWSDL